MKRLLYILLVIMAFLPVSCVRENFPQNDTESVPDGYMKIEFAANIADPTSVTTRAVDPDGLDVNNMTLFCFNEFGLFISTETATIKQHTGDGISDSGIYTAQIPSHTRIIHFLGNHSEGLYDETNFPGQTESMVIANMEGGSGMLVYWSRFEMDANSQESMHDQLSDLKYEIGGKKYNGIKLIRNQAKISIENWNTSYFTVTGFRTVNIPAFGTVAPHHPQHHFHIVDNWESTEEFVTLPDNQSLMSDIIDINTKNEDYIFETENSGDRQVSVIVKGRNAGENADKYYRIVMQHEDGSNFMIRRNHNYNIQITGKLTYGKDTFEEALVAPATNNAWISIDEWVNEITDGTKTLYVEQTSYVLASDQYAGTDFVVKYKYTEGTKGASEAPQVTWIDNNVAYDNIGNSYNTSTGEGTLTLRLYPMYEGNEQQIGSFIIKHGKLQRKVSIYVIKTQYFTPSWISSQVYGVADEHVTVMFTIPETCPEALFPFTVLVSANHLDVRSESGQQLPVYIKGEEGYYGQEWEGINYKYAYTITGPGKHRLHMRSILKHEDNDTEEVHLEAEFFETITKTVFFSGHGNTHRRIFLENLHLYGNTYAQDEGLYYILVPQKKASPLMFTIDLQERQNDGSYENFNHANAAIAPNAHLDEFLVYTRAFSFYDDYFGPDSNIYNEMEDHAWEGEITTVREDTWSTNGRVMAFRTLNAKGTDTAKYGLQEDGSYNIYMLTNSSSNIDVIRVASNNSLSPYVFEKDRNGNAYSGYYKGNEYRSVIFDVGHYRPFRFAAQLQVYEKDDKSDMQTIPEASELLSNEFHGDKEENVDEVLFSYNPGQKVDILLDVTSFKGSDGRSVHPFGQIFGEEFEIYIDAPMLEIDKDRLPESWQTSNKLREDPSKAGRFIYTVSKKRDDERVFGYAPAHNKDNSESRYDDYGGVMPKDKWDEYYANHPNEQIFIKDGNDIKLNQEGERKLLPFVKKSIATKYDITISTNKEKIVFWDKTFKVKTENMKGILKYKDAVDGEVKYVPDDAFIAFVRLSTNARIGVVTLNPGTGEAGWFELNLRYEYQFKWDDDPIDFYYRDKNTGKVYNFNYTENGVKKSVDLDLLYSLLQEENPTIILTEQPDQNL